MTVPPLPYLVEPEYDAPPPPATPTSPFLRPSAYYVTRPASQVVDIPNVRPDPVVRGSITGSLT